MMSWEKFQKSRNIPELHKSITCYAPFNHMRIRRDGHMSPCCFAQQLHRWQKDYVSLKDYWFGRINERYQLNMFSQNLKSRCSICKSQIDNGIIPQINDYDNNAKDDRLSHALDAESMPKVFEFEISNLCNMACPMCMGDLSSKHMLGRDKDLKKYDPNIFDDDENLEKLIEQFKEFIPHLNEVRFVGGEPLAHKGTYKICNLISDINPNLKIQICTNGSIYNKKVEKICKNNNLKISFSIDTVIPEEYKQIRIGGKYEQTFENIQNFKKNVKKINVNATLMSINVGNISKFFQYAIDNNFSSFINTYSREGRVNSPDWSLSQVDKSILRKSLEELESIETVLRASLEHRNFKVAQDRKVESVVSDTESVAHLSQLEKAIKLIQNDLLD